MSSSTSSIDPESWREGNPPAPACRNPEEACLEEAPIAPSASLAAVPATNTTNTDQSSSSPRLRVWASPWVLMLVALYAFAIPWMVQAILFRYFVKPQWGAALPGLDTTVWRKCTMRGHMAMGAISLLLGPLQFVSWIRRQCPTVHRWLGRLYCTCAMLSSVFGLTFTWLKGTLVGGWNMTVAFACAGSTIGILAGMAWQTARAAAPGGSARDYTSHRNWAIRSYSQILAPMLYRYWYICVTVFDLYQTPVPPRMGGTCRSDDICPDYLRLWDQVHCWTYWLSSLLIAELVIYYLPPVPPKLPEQTTDTTNTEDATLVVADAPEVVALQSSQHHEEQEQQQQQEDGFEDPGSTTFVSTETPLLPHGGGNPWTTARVRERHQQEEQHVSTDSPAMVNLLGWSLSVVTVATTVKFYVWAMSQTENA